MTAKLRQFSFLVTSLSAAEVLTMAISFLSPKGLPVLSVTLEGVDMVLLKMNLHALADQTPV